MFMYYRNFDFHVFGLRHYQVLPVGGNHYIAKETDCFTQLVLPGTVFGTKSSVINQWLYFFRIRVILKVLLRAPSRSF